VTGTITGLFAAVDDATNTFAVYVSFGNAPVTGLTVTFAGAVVALSSVLSQPVALPPV
jgi:hypothetical protein